MHWSLLLWHLSVAFSYLMWLKCSINNSVIQFDSIWQVLIVQVHYTHAYNRRLKSNGFGVNFHIASSTVAYSSTLYTVCLIWRDRKKKIVIITVFPIRSYRLDDRKFNGSRLLLCSMRIIKASTWTVCILFYGNQLERMYFIFIFSMLFWCISICFLQAYDSFAMFCIRAPANDESM